MVAVAARSKNAEKARLRAEVFLARLADGAFATADPRKHEVLAADRDAGCAWVNAGPERHHLSGYLVAHREGQRHAAVGDAEPPGRAKIVAALPQMQIAVAHPGSQGAHQHFAAVRDRRRLLGPLQRLPELRDIIADHGVFRSKPLARTAREVLPLWLNALRIVVMMPSVLARISLF